MIREINQYPSTKIKILIVDDHPAIRSTMSDVLINEILIEGKIYIKSIILFILCKK